MTQYVTLNGREGGVRVGEEREGEGAAHCYQQHVKTTAVKVVGR